MSPPVFQDNSGHTLVEMMVAILILLVALLGLMEAINLGIRTNLSNKLRNDAMHIADEQMYMRRTMKFDDLKVDTTKTTAIKSRSINGFVNYSVQNSVYKVGNTKFSKKLSVTVSWKDRGSRKELGLTSIFSTYSSQK